MEKMRIKKVAVRNGFGEIISSEYYIQKRFLCFWYNIMFDEMKCVRRLKDGKIENAFVENGAYVRMFPSLEDAQRSLEAYKTGYYKGYYIGFCYTGMNTEFGFYARKVFAITDPESYVIFPTYEACQKWIDEKKRTTFVSYCAAE